MARGKGRSGRRYVRDAKGRFASKGYVGQTGGRGARLKSAGKKREGGGERHILRSAESKAAGRAATATAVKSGNIILSRKLGGQGKSRDSAEFKAAQAAKRAAQAKRDAAELRSGLPKSGGAMRVRGGIKRDPKAGEKLKALRQRNQGAKQMSKEEFARRTGGKTRADSMSFAIEMSRQPRGRTKAGDRRNEARLRKVQDEIRATDKAYDAAIKAGRIKPPTRRLADIASGHSDNASVQAARRLQAKAAAKRAARQAARKPAAKTTKSPVNKAKTAYKAARADARMRKQDLKGADTKERRMANTAAAKVKNMERRRSASVPKASADSPRSRQTAKEIARRKRAAANKRQAYDRWDKGMATDKDSRKASVAKRAQAIYEGRIDPKVKTRARLTQTRNPDVLRDRIKRGEKLTAAKAKKAASKRRKRK